VARKQQTGASAPSTSPNRPPRELHAPLLGRRERKRRETLARIKAAAFELFNQKGYEQTTVREIAARAQVGFGTLFSHAPEKRELLFLLFYDLASDTFDRSFRAAARDAPLADQLTAIFVPVYRMHAPNPKLGRALIGELTFTADETLRSRFPAFDRPTFIARIAAVIERAKTTGRIKTEADNEFAARVVFAIFTGALRAWLAGPKPVASAGLAELKREFELLVTGLEPTTGAQARGRQAAE
jgi:AcrR family transcriptional regulator